MSTSASKDEGVTVGLRIRPLLARDLAEGAQECLRKVAGEPQVVLGADRAFTFNHVFSPQATQGALFDECMRPIVESVLEGYNATVLAYGQVRRSSQDPLLTAHQAHCSTWLACAKGRGARRADRVRASIRHAD